MKKFLVLAALAVMGASAQSIFVPSNGSYVGLSLQNTNPAVLPPGQCVYSTQVFNYLTGHMWGCVGAPGLQVWTDTTTTGGSAAWGAVTGTLANQTDLAAALAAKAPTSSPTFSNATCTGTCTGFGGGGGGGTWGSITGTLSSQTDLNSALAAKAPTASPTFSNATCTGTCTGFGSGTGAVSGANVNGGAVTLSGGTLQFQLPNLTAGPGVAVVPAGSGNSQIDTPYAVDLIDDQTGTSYTIPAADAPGTVRSNNASAVAWTLPQAGLGSNSTTTIPNFFNGSKLRLMNKGAGAVTVTLSGASHIGVSGTSLTIPAGTDTNPSWVVLTSDGNVNADGGHYVIGENNLGGSGGGGGSTILHGTYAARPATCTSGSEYKYDSGVYQFAMCNATNVWTTYLNGLPITVPAEMTIASNSFNRSATLASTNGYESVSLTSASGSFERYWTAPGTPYTKYVFFDQPTFLDYGSYQFSGTGFEDSTGARIGVECGVGSAAVAGFYCRVVNYSSSDVFGAAQVAPNTNITGGFAGISGTPTILALADNGTNITMSLCSRVGNCTQFYTGARASVIGAPVRLYYGALNNGGTQTNTIDFLGVY